MEQFENTIKEDLHRYLRACGTIDERLPECPDLEELWPAVAEAYLPDGIREFTGYPTVSLGWPMFVGMALAKWWDTDWSIYSGRGGKALYELLRDAEGYDNLDDYILHDILGLSEEEAETMGRMVGECASLVLHRLQHSGIEPGTADALKAYIAAIHQLYLMGIYTELNRLGYHMTAL